MKLKLKFRENICFSSNQTNGSTWKFQNSNAKSTLQTSHRRALNWKREKMKEKKKHKPKCAIYYYAYYPILENEWWPTNKISHASTPAGIWYSLFYLCFFYRFVWMNKYLSVCVNVSYAWVLFDAEPDYAPLKEFYAGS